MSSRGAFSIAIYGWAVKVVARRRKRTQFTRICINNFSLGMRHDFSLKAFFNCVNTTHIQNPQRTISLLITLTLRFSKAGLQPLIYRFNISPRVLTLQQAQVNFSRPKFCYHFFKQTFDLTFNALRWCMSFCGEYAMKNCFGRSHLNTLLCHLLRQPF